MVVVVLVLEVEVEVESYIKGYNAVHQQHALPHAQTKWTRGVLLVVLPSGLTFTNGVAEPSITRVHTLKLGTDDAACGHVFMTPNTPGLT